MTYHIFVLCKVHLLLLHSSENDLEGVQQVLKDGDFPLASLGQGEALCVYQAHLLEHCRLARLSSSYRETVSKKVPFVRPGDLALRMLVR
jgi:hypothetical protein